MVRRFAKCLAMFCLVVALFLVSATMVCAADDQTDNGNNGSGMLDMSTGIGAATLLGVGGGGAIVVSRNNRKRHNRMVRNNQVPGEMSEEQHIRSPFGGGHGGSTHNPFIHR